MPLFIERHSNFADYGLLAIRSRHSGAWSSMKMVTNVCDAGGATVEAQRVSTFESPKAMKRCLTAAADAVYLDAGARNYTCRLEAAREFARLNRVNRMCRSKKRRKLRIRHQAIK